jgi:hypothetical protein
MLNNHLLAAAAMALVSLNLGNLRAEETASTGKWVQLFDGKSLNGWQPKITGYDLNDNFGDTFRVENGLLKVVYDQYERFDNRFGHLIYEKPFSNYRLRVEYRFVGQQIPGGPSWAWRNSGIMIHGQAPETMTKSQSFPVSVEVQLLGGRPTGQRTTANVCTPGTHIVMAGKLVKQHCNSSKSQTYRGDRWVTVELEVRGNRVIKHIIDGVTVLQYTQPQLDETDPDAKPLIINGQKMLSGGYISLQSESHPVEFRKVELMELN